MSKKILVVDDEPQIVRLLASRLKANGYEVTAAYDGYQCVKMAHQERPDLIILDLKMPAGGGLSAYEHLSQSTTTVATPVIFISAYPSEQAQKQVTEMGTVAFITKPFDPDELLGKVNKALNPEQGSEGEDPAAISRRDNTGTFVREEGPHEAA